MGYQRYESDTVEHWLPRSRTPTPEADIYVHAATSVLTWLYPERSWSSGIAPGWPVFPSKLSAVKGGVLENASCASSTPEKRFNHNELTQTGSRFGLVDYEDVVLRQGMIGPASIEAGGMTIGHTNTRERWNEEILGGCNGSSVLQVGMHQLTRCAIITGPESLRTAIDTVTKSGPCSLSTRGHHIILGQGLHDTVTYLASDQTFGSLLGHAASPAVRGA
ncbi:hypothetical protein V8E53_015001 [Lactarius tabidus]